jgi:hypothetical protein
MWLVRQTGKPDARFDSEAKAREHGIKLAAFAATRGDTTEVRIEGSDGAWRSLPLDEPASRPTGRA